MQELGENLQVNINELLDRYPRLCSNRAEIIAGYHMLEECYQKGRKILIAGNGGSSADANHIVGELMKGFCLPRNIPEEMIAKLLKADSIRGLELAEKLQEALPAIALDNHNALNTAFSNDVDGKLSYAQQVYGYGVSGDVFLGITTSGNSENILYAAVVAKAKGLKILGLTGKNGGKMRELSDVCVNVNETETYKVQELHLPVYHCWCLMLEDKFYRLQTV